jgi:DNA-binding NarL/FixJ family response regulator
MVARPACAQTGGVENGEAGLKVFVVEDAAEVRKRITAMLRTIPGVAVVGEAESVREAIKGVPASRANVLLLDLQLADGNGLDVLSALKPEHPALRVIVLSNFATAPYRQASLAAGADVFLDKSQEFGRVPDTLRRWLET